jgi:hypothetical protein
MLYILFLSTTSSRDVRMFSFPKSTAPVCLEVTVYCIPFYHQQCVNMRVYPFPPPAVWTRRCIPFHSMSSDRSPTGMNKNTDAGSSRYRNKGTQSGTGILRYRNELFECQNTDACGIGLDADAQLWNQCIEEVLVIYSV